MARSIKVAIDEALDAAVAERRITREERGSVKQFTGYKGEADGVDPQRYYVDAQLSEFFEIRLDDIVAEVNLGGETSSSVLVLARAEATVKHLLDLSRDNRQVRGSQPAPNSFLTGDITARNVNRFGANVDSINPHNYMLLMFPLGGSVMSFCGGDPGC